MKRKKKKKKQKQIGMTKLTIHLADDEKYDFYAFVQQQHSCAILLKKDYVKLQNKLHLASSTGRQL